MMVANATGCSSIYGGSAPSTPYCASKRNGYGPAWANSLFEDNAEYGLGMALGVDKMRNRISRLMKEAINTNIPSEMKAAFQEWIDGKDNAEKSIAASEKVMKLITNSNDPIAIQILDFKQYLVKKSVWIFGGDGWHMILVMAD